MASQSTDTTVREKDKKKSFGNNFTKKIISTVYPDAGVPPAEVLELLVPHEVEQNKTSKLTQAKHKFDA